MLKGVVAGICRSEASPYVGPSGANNGEVAPVSPSVVPKPSAKGDKPSQLVGSGSAAVRETNEDDP